MSKIILAEPPFISIQGEGSTVGKVSTFIRFSGCNFHCNFCDSKFTWEGSKELREEFNSAKDFVEKYRLILLHDESRNIVFTGGEPTLYQEQVKEIVECIEAARIRTYSETNANTYEMETNGSIPLTEEFIIWSAYDRLFQYNISPKLQFNEYNDIVLDNIKKLENSTCFYIIKFVDDRLSETRVEILDFIKKSCEIMKYPELRWADFYVMPECITREEHVANFQSTMDFCIRFNLSFSPRVHILLWDKKRGV